MWIKLLLFGHLAINFIALFFLVRNGSKPFRIWAWMMTIFAIPILGACIYFLFGVNRRKKKLFNTKKIEDSLQWRQLPANFHTPEHIEGLQNIRPHFQNLVNLISRTSKSPLTFNNQVTLLNDGLETFDAIFDACEKAKTSIYLQYYIFAEGQLANRFAEIFARKVQEGVSVKFIYDAFGSWGLSKKYLNRLTTIGVEHESFLPLRLGGMGRTNYRNHRKIVVVDGVVGFTGGVNVADKYITDSDALGHWTDTHLKIAGMAVNFLKFMFLRDWFFLSKQNLISKDPLITMSSRGHTPIQIVDSGPDSDHASILQVYVHIISVAQEYVYIANSYVIPNEALLLALKTSALSGVDVRMVVPQRSDSEITKWAVRSYFQTLLDSGVKIYLYQPGFLHSKIILSDDAVCSVGTANLDIRSFEQNFEVNALAYHKETTLQLKKRFELFIDNSIQLDAAKYRRRPRKDKTRENLARLVSPIM